MNDFPPLDELVEALMEDADPRIRAEAARLVGVMSHTLNSEDREFAKQVLNRAMLDSDPMVLMSVMNAIGQFPSVAAPDDPIEEEDIAPVKADSCAVCGKPMALVDGDTCQYDSCPYR
jgi:hypothetical protein